MDSSKIKNMRTRAISGAVYVALIVVCLLLKPAWFTALMAVFAVLAVVELENLLSERAPVTPVAKICDILMALCLVGLSYNFKFAYPIALYLPIRIIIAVNDRTENPARSMLYSLLAVFYAALPLAMLAFANALCGLATSLGYATNLVLVTFIMIWVNDTFAYLTGMSMGRNKMCERLSPKKTWEGFAGGFAACIITGIIVAIWFAPHAQIFKWILYAAAVSVVGTYGDLFESLLKRTLGVKDSGHLIPGHGGILDRIDSVLAVAPITLLFLFFN